MPNQPAIPTDRLLLRPLNGADAPAVHRLISREIADTAVSIPYPFPEPQVREWIAGQSDASARGTGVAFGIELQDRQLAGVIVLRDMDQEHSRAELSLWIGLHWWGKGYATEAARSLLKYGFEELGLNRIHAFHLVRNPASGRVLEKIGMNREGLLRQPVRRWDKFEDVVLMAILRQDWLASEPEVVQ